MVSEVWETAGVWASGMEDGSRKGWVYIREVQKDGIQLKVGVESVVLTPYAAKRLAKQLNRAYRRAHLVTRD